MKAIVAFAVAFGCHTQPLPRSSPTAVTFFVALGGSDLGSGQRESPFGTLEHARDVIRERMNEHGLPRGAIVQIRGGNYVRTQPFVLGERDSGTATAPIVYEAAAGETVRIMGGPPLPHLEPITDRGLLDRLPAEAHGNAGQVDLKRLGISDFGSANGGGLELFFDTHPMPLARWPNEGFAYVDRVIGGQPFEIRGQRGDHVGTFTYEGDRPARWLAEPEVWLHGYWFWDWSDSREQVASIDPDRHVIELKPPYHQYGYRSGQWFYAYGLLAELDQPGEWYIDRSHGTLVFWPPHRGGETIVSVASELLVLHDVSHVTFRGLTLEAARGSAILIDGGHDDEIERCVIRNVGGWGVRVSGGSAHGVDRSEITGTGLGGISLQGGDRTTLEPGGHHAIGNHIHHYSRWARTVQPAIEISGVGLHVADNYIHDAPHQAIAFSGNDHVIERNVIERVCEETNDAGAIYGGRDWTARGTTIRDNVFRDIRGLEGRGAIGVYLDDMLSGTIVEGNRFERVTRAVFIGGGRDNVVEHNTFLQCTFGIHIDARGLGWAAASLPEQMEPRLRAMPITSPTWRAHYPALASILDENPAAPRGNVVTHNVSKDGGWDEIEPAARALAVITENEVEGAR